MISKQDVTRIAMSWVEAFSVDPNVLRNRDMGAWDELDDLIYKRPQDALLIFEEIAGMDLINWTFEGIAIGPLRTLLMAYGDRYGEDLDAIGRRSKAFGEMRAIASDGL